MIRLSVKYGGQDVDVDALDPSTTVSLLKERLESQTGVFARHQKLIFKGKVLEDKASLAGSKLGDGSKLMMLASPNAGQAPKAAAAGAASRPSLLARPQPGAAAGGRQAPGSSRPGAAGSGAEGGSSSLKAVPLPERRAGWAKMGVVALRDLGLEAVPPECFEGLGDAVRGADLSQNRLTAVTPAIGSLPSLSSLRLSENALADGGLPWDALAGLRCLTLLALDGNALTRLPAALGRCSALVKLSVSGNAVAEVEGGALAGLGVLRELDLSGNRLAVLPEDVGCCTSLEDLNACDNAIAAIPESTSRLERLQSLRLDNNRVKALPPGLFTGCSSLAALLLRGNPITVDALRAAPGYGAYEARRRARTDKQLGGRVMSDIERAFCEGADVLQWEHHK